MKNTVFNITAAIFASLMVIACGDKFEFGTPTHDLNEGVDLSKGETHVLWTKNAAVYETGRKHPLFRIPSLLKTENKLFAFCEAREKADGSDNGNVDLVYKVSEDGGTTWSQTKVFFDDHNNTCGNMTAVYTDKGRIVVLCSWERTGDRSTFKSDYFTFDETIVGNGGYYCQVVSFYSDDEGETWHGPDKWFTQNRNAEPDKYKWSGFIKTGPGHAIQLKNGEHKGRIIVGCDHKYEIYNGVAVAQDAGNKDLYGSHIAYSDDEGETWSMLELNEELQYGNECNPVELSDGRVYLDMRNMDLTAASRGYSVSSDGGGTWTEFANNPVLVDPSCQGSVVNYTTDGKPTSTIIMSNNNNAEARKNLSLRVSKDDCATWKEDVYEITAGHSGYSDLVVFEDGSIGVLYENGSASYYDNISFRRIPASTIKEFINK